MRALWAPIWEKGLDEKAWTPVFLGGEMKGRTVRVLRTGEPPSTLRVLDKRVEPARGGGGAYQARPPGSKPRPGDRWKKMTPRADHGVQCSLGRATNDKKVTGRVMKPGVRLWGPCI